MIEHKVTKADVEDWLKQPLTKMLIERLQIQAIKTMEYLGGGSILSTAADDRDMVYGMKVGGLKVCKEIISCEIFDNSLSREE